MIHKDIIALNLGCGPSGIEGWLNYDWGVLPFLSKLPYIRKLLIKFNVLDSNYDTIWPKIKLVDIRLGLPLKNGSVKYIYCSHVLEHFEKKEAVKIIKECHRVLEKGGVLRVVLPDLKKMIGNYKKADDFNRAFWGYDKDVSGINNYFIRGHQWMYDKKSFADLLKPIFDKVNFKNCGEGKVPDIDKLDLKIHEDHSFYIEATK